jgi:hypothetical protein
MTEPVQTCQICGQSVTVTPDGRGFPPDIAKRKLQRICKANGCACQPKYTPGFAFGPRARGQEGSRL